MYHSVFVNTKLMLMRNTVSFKTIPGYSYCFYLFLNDLISDVYTTQTIICGVISEKNAIYFY